MTYIDSKYKCYTTDPDGTFREVEVEYFSDKCKEFIEGHRHCPEGESYVREDGEKFYGPCTVPFKPFDELDAAQREYERQKLTEYNLVLQELGVET